MCSLSYLKNTKLCLYADDAAVFCKDRNINTVSKLLQKEFTKICNWVESNNLELNLKKCKSMLIGSKRKVKNANLIIKYKKEIIEQVHEFKYLGVVLDDCLSWNKHIEKVFTKISRIIGCIRQIKHNIPQNILIMLYNALILPHIDYGIVIWGRTSKCNIKKIQKLQNKYARLILNADFSIPTNVLHTQLNWQTIVQRQQYQTYLIMFKLINDLVPTYLKEIIVYRDINFQTRYARSCPLKINTPRTEYYKKSLHFHGSNLWNSLPQTMQILTSFPIFKKQTRTLTLNY